MPEMTITMKPTGEEPHDMEKDKENKNDESNKNAKAKEDVVTLDDFYKTWKHVGTSREIAIAGEAHELPCAPGLWVKGFGDIPLPLNKKTAQDLRQVCSLAKGSTRTFQINADQVNIKNPTWKYSNILKKLVEKIATELDVAADLVSSRLDMLLLQEEGESVDEFRPTEQDPKVFANLFVQLPSIYKGGSFTITNEGGGKKVFSLDCDGSAPFQCKYVAHYNECKHESLPISSGCRLVLKYSLLYNGTDRSKPSVRGINQDQYLTLFRRLEKGVGMFGVPIVGFGKDVNIEELTKRERVLAESALKVGGWEVVIAKLTRVDTEEYLAKNWGVAGYRRSYQSEAEIDKLWLLDGSNGKKHESHIKNSLNILAIEDGGVIEYDWEPFDSSEEYGCDGSTITYTTEEAFALVLFRVDQQSKEPSSKRPRLTEKGAASS